MIIIKHRVNNSKNLNKLNINYGLIDLRSYNKDIYLHHDPFKGKNLKIGLRNITIANCS